MQLFNIHFLVELEYQDFVSLYSFFSFSFSPQRGIFLFSCCFVLFLFYFINFYGVLLSFFFSFFLSSFFPFFSWRRVCVWCCPVLWVSLRVLSIRTITCASRVLLFTYHTCSVITPVLPAYTYTHIHTKINKNKLMKLV